MRCGWMSNAGLTGDVAPPFAPSTPPPEHPTPPTPRSLDPLIPRSVIDRLSPCHEVVSSTPSPVRLVGATRNGAVASVKPRRTAGPLLLSLP